MLEDFFQMMVLPTLLVIILLSIILLPLLGLSYFASCKQADIFNKINETNYTCSDFFWAGEQINSRTQTIKLNQ